MCKNLELQNSVLTDKEIKKHSWEWVVKFHYGIIKKKKKRRKDTDSECQRQSECKTWGSRYEILQRYFPLCWHGRMMADTPVERKSHEKIIRKGKASVLIAAWMEGGRTWTWGVCMWIVSAGPFLLGLASWMTGSCFKRNDTPLLKPSLTTLSENKTKEKTNNKKTQKTKQQQQQEKPSPANFCSKNTLLLTWHHWIRSWEEKLTVGSCQLLRHQLKLPHLFSLFPNPVHAVGERPCLSHLLLCPVPSIL